METLLSQRTSLPGQLASMHVCIRVNLWIFPGLTVIDQDVERDFLLLKSLDELPDGLQRRQIAI